MIWNRHSKRYSDRTYIENKEKGAGMIRIFGKRKCSKPEKGIRSVDLIEYDPERREKKCIKPWSAGKGVRIK